MLHGHLQTSSEAQNMRIPAAFIADNGGSPYFIYLAMPGILYLVPNTLGPADSTSAETLAAILPAAVQAQASRLDYFIAENAKTTRAFLKLINTTHPLAKPLQEINISELNVNTDAAALPGLLAPLLAGFDQQLGLLFLPRTVFQCLDALHALRGIGRQVAIESKTLSIQATAHDCQQQR